MGDYTYELEPLSNGLRLAHLALPHVHSVHLGAYVRAGAIYEDKSNSGVSHLLEHLHITTTIPHPTRNEMLGALDACPGRFDAHTTNDQIVFSFATSPAHVGEAVELLREILEIREYEPDVVESEKRLIHSEFIATSYAWDVDRINPVVFKRTALGLPVGGTPRSVAKLTLDEIKAYDTKAFAPDRIVVTLVGPIDGEDLDALRATLGQLQGNPRKDEEVPAASARTGPFIGRMAPPSHDDNIAIGFTLPCDMGVEERVCLTFLHFGLFACSSPLFSKLTYEVSNTYSRDATAYEIGSQRLLVVSGHPRKRDRKRFAEEVLREMRRIRCGDVAMPWFDHVKADYLLAVNMAKDDPAAIGTRIGEEELRSVFRPVMTLEAEIAALQGLTPSQLTAFAERFLRLDNLFLLLGGRANAWQRSRFKVLAERYLG